MSIDIRPATLADEAACLDLLEQLFEIPGARAPGYTRQRGSHGFRWAVEGERSDVLLALDGGSLVGLASVYRDIESIRYGPRTWLQDLVVDRDVRSGGVGKALLAAAADWARERGCTHLALSSGWGRQDAHRFYEREGMARSMNYELWLDD
jgi:GNAT superfamily N-acetyltransferase